MISLQDVLRKQPYPCFKLTTVPENLKHQLKTGMLCLYNIEKRIFEFPIAGQFGTDADLFSCLDFLGYYSIEDFRDMVFAGRLPVSCPSCKGPALDAGLISFELEEMGTAPVDCANGDAEIFVCELLRQTIRIDADILTPARTGSKPALTLSLPPGKNTMTINDFDEFTLR